MMQIERYGMNEIVRVFLQASSASYIWLRECYSNRIPGSASENCRGASAVEMGSWRSGSA